MRFIDTDVAGAKLIEMTAHWDDRGRFGRAWCVREFEANGIVFFPVQANTGLSLRRGTLRGMHFQEAPALGAKLVLCTRGAMFDVLIDLRADSSTYGRWYGAELSAENGRMLYVPEHCAHRDLEREDCTEMCYMTSQFYAPDAVRGVRFDDPAFRVEWPLVPTVVSKQD